MLFNQMPRKLPKHIFNLLLLLGAFALLAITAKIYLTDSSFYKFGHYRADAVPAIAAGTPLYQGSVYCETCHEERLLDWSTGIHSTVQCEVCHGTDREHPDDGRALIPADTIRLCTLCHEAMPARPARQPQIISAEHPFPGDEPEPCQNCHDPHSPGDNQMAEAALTTESLAAVTAGGPGNVPVAVSKCAKCHGKQGEGHKKNPALAGLESTVFIERINMYISGARDNRKMVRYAKSLSDEEIAELAQYYENLPAISPQ